MINKYTVALCRSKLKCNEFEKVRANKLLKFKESVTETSRNAFHRHKI
jgi:hypothetical protein